MTIFAQNTGIMIFEDSLTNNQAKQPETQQSNAGDSTNMQATVSGQLPLLKKKKKKAKDSVTVNATADTTIAMQKAGLVVQKATPIQCNVPPCKLDPNREGSYTAYFSIKTPPALPAQRSFNEYDLRRKSVDTLTQLPPKPTVDSLSVKAVVDSSKVLLMPDSSKKVGAVDADSLIPKLTYKPDPQTMHQSLMVEKYVPKMFRTTWSDKDWMLWYIIASFIVLIVARFTYKKYIQQIFVASANIHVTNRLFRERNSLTSRVSLLLNMLFCFNAGLFIYQILHHFSITVFEMNGFFTAIIISVLLSIMYIGKYLIMNVIGFLFNEEDLIDEYNHTVFLFNKIVGLLLFPVIIMMPYLKNQYINETHIIASGLFVIIAAYALRLLRGIVLSLRQNISIFYTFLYLCILEFVPLILLLKAVLVVFKYL